MKMTYVKPNKKTLLINAIQVLLCVGILYVAFKEQIFTLALFSLCLFSINITVEDENEEENKEENKKEEEN